MAVISGLLARLGFVRIGTYGLILTSEGRILSTRHAVLDDGLGGKIVGWNEGDLATMELERWHPGTPPATAKRIAPPLMRPPVAPPKPVQALVIAPVRAPSPVQVAHPGPADEDEWEWEIAVARARAAADPIPTKTEEIHEEIFETWEATPPPRKLPLQRVAHVPAKPPVTPEPRVGKTVIPVPPLSARVTLTRQMPVVEPAPVRRYPRATSRHEETIRTHAAPPANDDLTAPSIALPPAPVASSARRASAKQR